MTRLGLESVLILGVVIVGGCPADEGGNGNPIGGASSSSSSGGGTTAADPTAGTAGGTGTSSGDPTAGTSTGGSDTADGTTAATTDPPPESTSDSEGETEGPSPGEGEPYGPCTREGTCTDADGFCFIDGGTGRTMCLPPCDGDNGSCPMAPPDNGTLVECIEIPAPASPHCMLNCAGGTQCPEGTDCIDLGGYFRCLWP
jgi:hypothetical protein